DPGAWLLSRGKGQPRLQQIRQEGPRALAEARVRGGAAGGRQGQARDQQGEAQMRARASAVLLACIGVALVLGAAARSAAGHAPSFEAAKSDAIGGGPNFVAVTDLNGDGSA